jgi:hypothetical protein
MEISPSGPFIQKRAHPHTAPERSAGAAGARDCDPQRTPGKSRPENCLHFPLPSACGGSQSRAPGRRFTVPSPASPVNRLWAFVPGSGLKAAHRQTPGAQTPPRQTIIHPGFPASARDPPAIFPSRRDRNRANIGSWPLGQALPSNGIWCFWRCSTLSPQVAQIQRVAYDVKWNNGPGSLLGNENVR